jgi:Protein of unknown function (DUF3102)
MHFATCLQEHLRDWGQSTSAAARWWTTALECQSVITEARHTSPKRKRGTSSDSPDTVVARSVVARSPDLATAPTEGLQPLTDTNVCPTFVDDCGLAESANSHHQSASDESEAFLEHVRQAGETLSEAKRRCPEGEWANWVKTRLTFSLRTAQRYMQIAAAWPQIEAQLPGSAVLTMRHVLQVLASEERCRGAPNGLSAKRLWAFWEARDHLDRARRLLAGLIAALVDAHDALPNLKQFNTCLSIAKMLGHQIDDWRNKVMLSAQETLFAPGDQPDIVAFGPGGEAKTLERLRARAKGQAPRDEDPPETRS